MIDAFGTEVKVGDTVVVCRISGRSSCLLGKALVTGITGGRASLQYEKAGSWRTNAGSEKIMVLRA